MKMCTRCSTTKPLDDFAINQCARDGRSSWCRACFAARYRERRAELRPCGVEGCDRWAQGSFCGMHYTRLRRTGEFGAPEPILRMSREGFCSVTGCGRPIRAVGYCTMHYHRLQKDDVAALANPAPLRPVHDASCVSPCTYTYVSVGDERNRAEHRVVVEQALGRQLRPQETVHHINGLRCDNRLENLERWDSSHPAGQRVQDKVAWAIELLELYAPEELSRNTLLAVAS